MCSSGRQVLDEEFTKYAIYRKSLMKWRIHKKLPFYAMKNLERKNKKNDTILHIILIRKHSNTIRQ